MRALLFIVAFIGLFISPWITLLCAVLSALRYPAWEVIVLGFLADSMWLAGPVTSHVPLATILTITLVFVLDPLRNEFLTSESALV